MERPISTPATAEQGGGRPYWAYFLGAGLGATFVYIFVPSEGVIPSALFLGTHLCALLAIAAGIVLNRPEKPLAWYIVLAGFAVYLVADAIWYGGPVTFAITLPYPGLSDWLYLFAYATLLCGFTLLIRARSGPNLRGAIDSMIVTIGLATISWVFIIAPAFDLSDLTFVGRLITVAYPLVDILLMSVLTRLLLSGGARPPAFWMLGASIVGQLVADSYYSTSSLNGSFSYDSPFLIGYLMFYVFLGSAAMHPSMSALTRRAPEASSTLTRARLAFLTIAAVVPPVVIVAVEVIDPPSVGRPAVAVVAAASGIMFTLVILHLSLDLSTRLAGVGDESVELTAREFALAETFFRHPGQVLSREQLLSRVWGYDYDPGSNVVDVYVGYLRRKLGQDRISAVRGMGYRLEVSAD